MIKREGTVNLWTAVSRGWGGGEINNRTDRMQIKEYLSGAFIVMIVIQFVPAAHSEKEMSCITPTSIPVLEMGLVMVI